MPGPSYVLSVSRRPRPARYASHSVDPWLDFSKKDFSFDHLYLPKSSLDLKIRDFFIAYIISAFGEPTPSAFGLRRTVASPKDDDSQCRGTGARELAGPRGQERGAEAAEGEVQERG